jgi:hypothetical protein
MLVILHRLSLAFGALAATFAVMMARVFPSTSHGAGPVGPGMGDIAPDFTLADSNGVPHQLSSLPA